MSGLLFVYGSLRRGCGNWERWLKGRSDFVGAARMRGLLHAVSTYPGMVDGDGEVVGDVFRLHDPAAQFAELDDFEAPDYVREQRAARVDGVDVTVFVYLYRADVSGKPVIPSGDWLAG